VNFSRPFGKPCIYLSLAFVFICDLSYLSAKSNNDSDNINLVQEKALQDSLEFVEVANGVFVFEGEIEEIFNSKNARVSNITFIVGSKAVAVIDTGSSFSQGKLVRAAIRKETQLPIKYIINTHVHLDHIFGNQAFVEDEPEFIAHKNYVSELAAKGPYYLSRMQAKLFDGSKIVNANRLITQEDTIDLGERLLRVLPVKRAHTSHDLMVMDVTTSVLVTGDLIFVDHCPVIDGSLTGWLTVLKEIEELDFSLLVPGHGPVQGNKLAIAKMTAYLSRLRDSVRTAIDQQLDLGVASETLLSNEARQWSLFEEFHKRNVIAAYTELEWE